MISILTMIGGVLFTIFGLSFLSVMGRMYYLVKFLSDDKSRLRLIILSGVMVASASYQMLWPYLLVESVGTANIAKLFLASGAHYYDICTNTCFHPPILLSNAAFLNLIFSFLEPVYRFKASIVIPNLIMGFLIFKWVGGNRGLLASILLLSNPGYLLFTAYMPSPDPLAYLIVFASLYMFESKHSFTGSVLLGIAFMIRQYTVYVALPVLVFLYARNGIRSFLQNLTIVFATCTIISLPFLLIGSAENYIRNILFNGFSQGFNVGGLVQFNTAFSGPWALVGLAERLFSFTVPNAQVVVFAVLILLFASVFYIIISKRVQNYWIVALLGIAVFILSSPSDAPHRTMIILPIAILIGSWGLLKKPIWLSIVLAPVLYRSVQYFTTFTSMEVSYMYIFGDICFSIACFVLIMSYLRLSPHLSTKSAFVRGM